jgi:sugar/nucleoside kinase (ribokinase family)
MDMLEKGIGVVGSTTIDEIVSPDQRIKKIGGATAYAGITYRRHAVDTIIISNLAPVDHEIRKRLEQENIRVFNGKTDRTTRFINYIEGDSRRQEVFNRARPILLRNLLPALKYIDGLHLSPLHPDDIEPKILTELPSMGLKVFVDIQGYTRKVLKKGVSAAVSRHLSDALKAADIIKANESEIRLVLDFFQMDLPQIMESFGIREAVITLGGKGGRVETQKGAKHVYAATRIDAVSDPTGAGDVFFAAYLLSRFTRNQEIARAWGYAADKAARQVEGKFIAVDRLVLP